MILTGRELNGEEAERIGLVTRVVPREKVLVSAMEVARELAAKSPLAVTFTKQANAAVRDMTISDAKKCLNEHFTKLAVSENGQEALKAKFSGRTPKWKGR